MNPDAIEAALLSGKPLQPGPSSPPDRPRRNIHRSIGSEEDEDEDNDGNTSSSSTGSSAPRTRNRHSRQPPFPSGPDPLAQPYANAQGRQTGVKGVLDDRRASALASRRAAEEGRADIIAEQARRGISAMTVHEEADARKRDEGEGEKEKRDKWREENKEDAEARARWRRARREELEREKERERQQDGMGRGGLREVGKEGYLGAVERKGWVVVLIYEPEIPRCQTLLSSLLALSLTHPTSASPPGIPIALFRARATSLRFSLLPPDSSSAHGETASSATTLNGNATGKGSFDDEEEEEEDDEEELGEDNGEPKARPDPDVLPTMLAYKDGELERTWIRVDWEVGEEGVEGLLKREGIIGKGRAGQRVGYDNEGDGDDED